MILFGDSFDIYRLIIEKAHEGLTWMSALRLTLSQF